jgi:hypothetical protein
LPRFYRELMRRDLGPLWKWLPQGALEHDPNAYLASEREHARPARQTTLGPARAEPSSPEPPRRVFRADAGDSRDRGVAPNPSPAAEGTALGLSAAASSG